MILRSADIRGALRSRQRGFLLNPARFGGGGGGPTDPSFANVSLLCHFNGTNGSTTITDNGPSPKTLTAFNGAQISTAQSVFGGASAQFDGVNDYISTPAHTSFDMGPGAFAIEGWVRFTGLTGTQSIVGQCGASGSNTTVSFVVQKDSAHRFYAFCCSGNTAVGVLTGTTIVTTGVWYYFAYTRSGNVFRLFVYGLQEAAQTQAVTVNSSSSALGIGRLGDFNGQYLNGHVDDLRITKAVARYTASFTPPVAQFPDS